MAASFPVLPVLLFTDFGPHGPYLGELHMAVRDSLSDARVVDLVNDAPAFEPRPAAYLLAALAAARAAPAVYLAVVDPGVGTGSRLPVVVTAGGQQFVGPDNGLFHVLARHRPEAVREAIRWRPGRLSASFHGRDLFAPVAARLAAGEAVETDPLPWGDDELAGWPADWPAVIYADWYGNLMTGLRAGALGRDAAVRLGGRELRWARTFGEVPPGTAFWYVNSIGLVEVAVNGGSAAAALGAGPGTVVEVVG